MDAYHLQRRKAILEAHPSVRRLIGPDLRLFPLSLLVALTQLTIGSQLSAASWPAVLLSAHLVGGSLSLLIFAVQHECQHKNVFGCRLHYLDDFLGWLLGAVGLVPYQMGRYRRKHLRHHRHLGDHALDEDRPSQQQVARSRSLPGKLALLAAKPLRSRLRLLKSPITAVQLVLMISIAVYLRGWKTTTYLFLSPALGRTLHPFGAVLLCSHAYLPDGKALTYSYRGPLNRLFCNIGYHIEHHDFPSVPASRLPEVYRLAPEFYRDLPEVKSWFSCMIGYLTDSNKDLSSPRD